MSGFVEKLPVLFCFSFLYWTESVSPSEQIAPSKFGFKLLQTFGITNGAVAITGGGKRLNARIGELSKSFEETILGFPLNL